MGLLDKIKSMIGGNSSQAKGGVDKVASTADEKTGGKYADKIDTSAEKAKEGIDKIGEKPGPTQPGPTQPGPTQPGPT